MTGLSLDQHTLESTTTPGIYAIGSLSTGVHFYTNGIDRNVVHASRISRHLVGKPVHPPVHVAIILPDGGMGWAGTLCRAITAMVQSNMIPFLYRSVRQCCSGEQGSTSSDEFHCQACGNGANLAGHCDDGLKNHSSHDFDRALPHLCQRLGIFIRECSDLDASFLNTLREHHIDIGLLVQEEPMLGMLSIRYVVETLRLDSSFYLLSPSQSKGPDCEGKDMYEKLSYYKGALRSIVYRL